MYETKELSEETWLDFERLFSRGNGWDQCWCTAFQEGRRGLTRGLRTRAEARVVNHEFKKDLVEQGRAHGILVYADGEPVGWCQYGSSDELHGHHRAQIDTSQTTEKLWRVTCFVVDKKHRRKGLAGIALRAVLDAIRRQGGGLVEAYPVASWSHGPNRATGAVHVQGVGPVGPAWGGFGNVSTPGVVSMFEKAGFTAVGVCGSRSARVQRYGAQGCQVLMHKLV